MLLPCMFILAYIFCFIEKPHSLIHSKDWSDTDLSRSENDIVKQRNMNLRHATVNLIQQERDALQQKNQQYAQELST